MIKRLALLVVMLLVSIPVFAESVDTAWVKRYDGPANSSDYSKDMAIDSSGNVYVTGVSFDSLTLWDYATIKYYPNGETAWMKRYNGPGNDDDKPNAIVIDDSGNVYVTGKSIGRGTSSDFATIKYSKTTHPADKSKEEEKR